MSRHIKVPTKVLKYTTEGLQKLYDVLPEGRDKLAVAILLEHRRWK